MCSWAMCDCSDDAGVFTFDLFSPNITGGKGGNFTHTRMHTHTRTHSSVDYTCLTVLGGGHMRTVELTSDRQGETG